MTHLASSFRVALARHGVVVTSCFGALSKDGTRALSRHDSFAGHPACHWIAVVGALRQTPLLLYRTKPREYSLMLQYTGYSVRSASRKCANWMRLSLHTGWSPVTNVPSRLQRASAPFLRSKGYKYNLMKSDRSFVLGKYTFKPAQRLPGIWLYGSISPSAITKYCQEGYVYHRRVPGDDAIAHSAVSENG